MIEHDFALLGKNNAVYITQEVVCVNFDLDAAVFLVFYPQPFEPLYVIWVIYEGGKIQTSIFDLCAGSSCVARAEGEWLHKAQRLCVDAKEGCLLQDGVFSFMANWYGVPCAN